MEKILIVDDEEMALNILSEFLALKGYDVHTAANGPAALEKVKKLKPDVVLLDIIMPGMGGIDVLKEVKKTAPDTGVIMVTALTDEEIARRTIELGAHDYVTKPIDFEYLSSTLLKEVALKKENKEKPFLNLIKSLILRPLTPEAESAIQGKKVEITKTPFRIGRAGTHNSSRTQDLDIFDREPFQVSREHCYIARIENNYYFVDSKSTLGSSVNGVRIGKHESKRSFLLARGSHKIALGSPHSPYLFQLDIPGVSPRIPTH